MLLFNKLCDFRSHIYQHELGGIAYHSQSQVLPINPQHYGKDYLTAEIISQHLFLGNDLHTPITTIICIENTLGGQVIPIEEIRKIRQLANKHQIIMHVDGARLWNACIATGLSLEEYSKNFDSVSLCLSKGLGAPVGSILVGNKDFIDKARQYRKLFGGGWRQAGILASACLFAIENNWKRMKEDHDNAKFLHDELLKLGFSLRAEPHTNIVYADTTKMGITWEQIIAEVQKLQTNESKKVIIESDTSYLTRFVVHLQIPKEGIQKLITLLHSVLKNIKQ